jgi:hypothetical protein
VDFEELNARGWAEVIEEHPCPKIAEGPGRVVTATITHANDDVRTLTMSSGETLQVTGNYRMFSATRADWVAVKDLHIGEELRTALGRESVASLGFQRGRHQVYNIEVETEHCYFVGNREVLTHNTYSPTDSADSGPRSGDTMRYGDFRKFPGDNIEGHELLQNSKLDQMGEGRGPMKADNPALALSKEDQKPLAVRRQKLVCTIDQKSMKCPHCRMSARMRSW